MSRLSYMFLFADGFIVQNRSNNRKWTNVSLNSAINVGEQWETQVAAEEVFCEGFKKSSAARIRLDGIPVHFEAKEFVIATSYGNFGSNVEEKRHRRNAQSISLITSSKTCMQKCGFRPNRPQRSIRVSTGQSGYSTVSFTTG